MFLSSLPLGTYAFRMLALFAYAAFVRWLFMDLEMWEYLDDCMPDGPNLCDASTWCLEWIRS